MRYVRNRRSENYERMQKEAGFTMWLYKIKIENTRHTEERLNRWSIDINKLFEALLYPEEVLTGHYGRFIAHKRYGTHIVRAVYE